MATAERTAPAGSYEGYEALFASVEAPFAFVDLDAMWANAFDMLQRAGGKPIRVATKSLRCRPLIASALENDPGFRVRRVYYPGLANHPGHELAKRQQLGFGAMISFEVGDGVVGVKRFVERLRHFTLAESLGGVESLVAHPATMTHASMDAAARERAGISDSLIRLSVGIEAVEDLCADLGAALEA